jgi:hypothetical protein
MGRGSGLEVVEGACAVVGMGGSFLPAAAAVVGDALRDPEPAGVGTDSCDFGGSTGAASAIVSAFRVPRGSKSKSRREAMAGCTFAPGVIGVASSHEMMSLTSAPLATALTFPAIICFLTCRSFSLSVFFISILKYAQTGQWSESVSSALS